MSSDPHRPRHPHRGPRQDLDRRRRLPARSPTPTSTSRSSAASRRFCEGRPLEEMPGLMARVCGICPVSHLLASSKAGDRILGVDVPVAAVKQRRLATWAQVLQSHALSFFHLSSPDLLLGLDAAPATRNLFAMAGSDVDFVRRGIRLRQFGQRTIELVGGRKVHPGWSVPGGVHCDGDPERGGRAAPVDPRALRVGAHRHRPAEADLRTALRRRSPGSAISPRCSSAWSTRTGTSSSTTARCGWWTRAGRWWPRGSSRESTGAT